MDGMAWVAQKVSFAIRGLQSGNTQLYVWVYLVGVLALGAVTAICLL
jgi:NADH-quinone oxidoreductase subunit L